jgi:hypothetical protein
MRNVFICWTPYQIIISIHAAQTLYQADTNDIYIVGHFANSVTVAQHLSTTGVFRQVEHINETSPFSTSLLSKASLLIARWKNAIAGFAKPQIAYDRIVTFSLGTLFVRKVAGKIIDSGGRVVILEEGLGSYLNTLFTSRPIDHVIECISNLCGQRIIASDVRHVSEFRYFKPELVSAPPLVPMLPLPALSDNIALKEVLEKVFSYQDEPAYTAAKLIFFSQPFPHIKDQAHHLEQQVIDIFMQCIPAQEVLIKIHPRDRLDKYSHSHSVVSNTSNAAVPWELVCMNQDMSGKTLTAISSSSLFTPYILWGTSYNVILLHQLFGYHHSGIEKFVSQFADTSACSVYAPESITELYELLGRIDFSQQRNE